MNYKYTIADIVNSAIFNILSQGLLSIIIFPGNGVIFFSKVTYMHAHGSRM